MLPVNSLINISKKSTMSQALYNIVDSAFVAQLNDNALTAVSLAFPVQHIIMNIVMNIPICILIFIFTVKMERNILMRTVFGKNIRILMMHR